MDIISYIIVGHRLTRSIMLMSMHKHLIISNCYYESRHLRKNSKTFVVTDAIDNRKPYVRMDDLDLRIISLLVAGRPNKDIASELKIPLSTIQRRTRRLFEKEAIKSIVEPNFVRLGLRKGVVHLYINNVDAFEVSKKLAEIPGMTSVSIHIGNSDIVGDIIYKDSSEVLGIIASCKAIHGVTKVVWSEEIYSSATDLFGKKISSYFKSV